MAFALSACAGHDAGSSANGLDAGSELPYCVSWSDPMCVTTTCKPIELAPGLHVNGVDAGWNGTSVGSDAAHPCSWPQPDPGANEDFTKRRLQWNCDCGEASWGPLDSGHRR